MTIKKIKTSDILGDNYYIYELSSSNYTPALNGTITITCICKEVYGNTVMGKTLTLYQNGTSKGAKTTDSNGVVTWSITCSSAGLQKFNIKDASIEVFVDDKAVSSHQHGNITSDGKLTTSHNGTYSTFVGVQDSTGTLYKASKINSDIIIDGTAHNNIGSNANDNQSAINTAINTALGNKANSTHSHSLSSLGGTVTVEKQSTAESGYAHTYVIKQNNTQVGSKINIPKDFLVKSATLNTCSTANNPVSGYSVGDKYLDFVVNAKDNSATDEHLYVLVSDLVDDVTIDSGWVTNSTNPVQSKVIKTALDGKADSSHTHNTTEIRDSSAYDRIGSGVNDTQADINGGIDYALAELDDSILYTKMDLIGLDEFQVKDFINPNNWENSGCTYSDGVLTFSGSNSFTATFPADFELSFYYIIDDGLVLDDRISFNAFGHQGGLVITQKHINDGYVIIDISFKSENNIGVITSEASGDYWAINDVKSLNPYTINAITPVGNYTKIANIKYKANNITSLNDNIISLYTDKENVYNKVTSISSSSTDTQYPSAKSVYNTIETKIDKLQKAVTTFSPIDYVVGENGAVWNNDNNLTLPNQGSTIVFNFTDMLNDTGDYFEWELRVSHGTTYLRDEINRDEIWDSSVNSMIRIRITKNEYSDSYHITTTDLSNNTIIEDYDKDYDFNLTFSSLSGCTFYFSNKKWYHTVSFIDMIYPIGSIYMSVNSINPSLFIGGEWEQIEDRFLLASGQTYQNGTTGGSADAVVVSHDHTQNAHQHGTDYGNYSFVVSENTVGASNKRVTAVSSGSVYVPTDTSARFHHYQHTNSQTPTINSNGVSGTGKNMPPYLTVYMWKRVA